MSSAVSVDIIRPFGYCSEKYNLKSSEGRREIKNCFYESIISKLGMFSFAL